MLKTCDGSGHDGRGPKISEIPDVVTLTTITSDWGNDIRDRTVQRYSSVANRTTEHPSPSEGDLSYLEDANVVEVYNGTAWVIVGGEMVYALATNATFQGSITGVTDLTGLAATVTVPTGGRRLKLTGSIGAQSLAAGSVVLLRIKEGGLTLRTIRWSPGVNGVNISMEGSVVISAAAGAHTYKLTLESSGGGVSRIGAGDPEFLLIEDLDRA